MKLPLSLLFIFLLSWLAPQAMAQSDGAPPCLPAGASRTLTFTRPPLFSPGTPVGAVWTGAGTGSPLAWEDDWCAADDYMGPGTPGIPPTTATVVVDNVGGKLSGPNGKVQNGNLFEGDCIEVKMEWTYLYPVTITKTNWLSSLGGGSSIGTTVTVWMVGVKVADIQEVCPC